MIRMMRCALVGALCVGGALISCGGSDSGGANPGVSCAADGVCQPACSSDPDCASGTGGTLNGGSGGTAGSAAGTGGGGPTPPPADPACAQYAGSNSPIPADLQAVLAPLPLVACAVDTCKGTPGTLNLPATSGAQYLIVTYVRGGAAYGFWMEPTQDLSNIQALTWSEEWPATLPTPANGTHGLVLNTCSSAAAALPVAIAHDGCGQATDGVALAYYYRPLNAQQCAAGALAGEDCVWNHNCSTGLVCKSFRCTSE